MLSASQSLVISAGQSLSAAVDLGTVQLYAMITPPQWDAAPISFQFSVDGVSFYDVSLGITGQSFTTTCIPGRWVPVDSATFPKGIRLKIRSGYPIQPIIQQADRVFTLVTG